MCHNEMRIHFLRPEKVISISQSKHIFKNSISIILQKRDIIIGKNSLNITDDIIKILDDNVKEIKIN